MEKIDLTYFDEESEKYLVKVGSGSTDIFIYPGYKFKIINSLIQFSSTKIYGFLYNNSKCDCSTTYSTLMT